MLLMKHILGKSADRQYHVTHLGILHDRNLLGSKTFQNMCIKTNNNEKLCTKQMKYFFNFWVLIFVCFNIVILVLKT